MANITIDTSAPHSPIGFLAGRIARLRAALRNWSCRRRLARTVEAELNQYSEQELVELGIAPADIKFIASDAAWFRVDRKRSRR